MKKFLALTLALVLVLALAACGGDQTPADTDPTPDASEPAVETVTVKVGATPAPHAEILEVIKDALAEEGVVLEIVEFDDYITPNTSLEDGSLDANYFQHITYLNDFNEEQGTHLVSAGAIHYEPFGLYAGKTTDLADLADGAKIAVPNDGTNEARALLLLEQEGLIKLKEGVGLSATATDVAENPHNYEIVEMKAELVSTTLDDVDVAVINGNYAIDAGLKVSEALAVEATDGLAAEYYANVLAVKEGNENSPAIQALVKALQSDAVKTFITETYDGAVVPLF